MKMTYDALNEIVHKASVAIAEEGVEMSSFDRCHLNNHLTQYLNARDIEFVEEEK